MIELLGGDLAMMIEAKVARIRVCISATVSQWLDVVDHYAGVMMPLAWHIAHR